MLEEVRGRKGEEWQQEGVGEVWLEDAGEEVGLGRTRGGAARGAIRGGSGSSQKRSFVPSTIPWQTLHTDTDIAPTPLTFSEPTGSQIVLPSNPCPVDFLSTFLDEDVLGPHHGRD